MSAWTAPGVAMPLDLYVADPAPVPSLSSRTIDALVDRSPEHAWWEHPRLNPAYTPTNGEALELGTLAHRMVLEDRPDTDGVVIIPAKDYRTKAAQTARDAARSAGLIPMLADDWAALVPMITTWRDHFQLLAPVPFQGGAPERTFIWQEGGVWFRTRPDYCHPGGADDLKTTSTSAHPGEWSRRRLWESGTYLQAALYHRAMRHDRRDPGEFRYIVCEVKPPYGVSAIALDPEALEYAERVVDEGRARWAHCLTENVWPGYPRRTAYAELLPWLKAKAIERPYYQGAQ